MSAADLRLGRWQDVLADVDQVDALIVDAPYSERTHAGHDKAASTSNGNHRSELSYGFWTPDDVRTFVDSWSPRTRGWFVSITDTELARVWEESLRAAGRYAFSPLAYLDPGSRVRISGDGPAQWATWIVVARPSTAPFLRWGALPGGYIRPHGEARDHLVTGGKPLSVMRALVRDYSRPGDLVCDPCAGGATTLLAALMEGRRAVGAEAMPEHYKLARKRLAKGYTPPLFADSTPAPARGRLDAAALEQLELGAAAWPRGEGGGRGKT